MILYRYVICNNDREWKIVNKHFFSLGYSWASLEPDLISYPYKSSSNQESNNDGYPLGICISQDSFNKFITYASARFFEELERDGSAERYPFNFNRRLGKITEGIVL